MLRLPLLKLCERRQTLFAISWKGLDGLVLSPLALPRSEEHTSELQSQSNLVCRLLLEKKKIKSHIIFVFNTILNKLTLLLLIYIKMIDISSSNFYFRFNSKFKNKWNITKYVDLLQLA